MYMKCTKNVEVADAYGNVAYFVSRRKVSEMKAPCLARCFGSFLPLNCKPKPLLIGELALVNCKSFCK